MHYVHSDWTANPPNQHLITVRVCTYLLRKETGERRVEGLGVDIRPLCRRDAYVHVHVDEEITIYSKTKQNNTQQSGESQGS